jgi:hypothetical protein
LFFLHLKRCGINLVFEKQKIEMLVAVKDDLRIQVSVLGQEVKINMPEMEDVLILWTSWIKQEERLAEIYLQSQYIQNPYSALKNYFQNKGWEIEINGQSN